MLALGTVMRASTSHDNPSNRRVAMPAWLTGAHVNAVLELEKSAHAVGIYVVADGRAAELDCVLKHGAQTQAQALQFGLGEAASAAA